ncbi:MAG: tetratricopeptide repeat protein [Nitrospinota bacterium]|nr:tetratricopeptide repeat protein [Nitrospinota bacterium]
MSNTKITFKNSYSIRIIITLILVLIVYSNTVYHPFHYDDIGVAVQRETIEGSLTDFWEKTIDSGGHIFLSRQFLIYSFALNYHWGEGSVVSYHIINIILHLLNTLLIYLILKNILIHNLSFNKQEDTLSKNSYLIFIPFFSSLIFAVHPLNTETVTFISSRSSGMCTFFYLLSLYLFIHGTSSIHGREKRKTSTALFYYTFSLIVFIIGIGIKEIIITLPAIILLYLYYFENREESLLKFIVKFKRYFIGIAFPAIIYLGYREIITGNIFTAQADAGLALYGRYYYFLTELKVIIFYYLKLFIFPINLNIYPMMSPSTSLFEFPVFISLLIILSLIIFAVTISWGRRQFVQNKVISFAVFWFFITLLPSSSFIPLNDLIAEHRAYLPAVGASMFFGTVFSIFICFLKNHVKLKLFKSFTVVLILPLFSLLNIQRNLVWKDGLTLWKDSALKTPNHAAPHINLGSEYIKKGLNKLAVGELKKAIELLPDYAESHYNLGKVYSNLRDYKNAATEFLLAIKYDKSSYKAMFGLGNTYSKTGQYDKAIDVFNKADQAYSRKWNKSYPDAIHNLGEVYGKMGKLSEAIKQFQKVLEIDADHVLAKKNLARAHKYLKVINKAD